MSENEFLRQIEAVFELDPESLVPECEFQQLKEWSSLTFLGLLALVDEELGIALTPQQLLACATVGDLLNVVKHKLEPAH